MNFRKTYYDVDGTFQIAPLMDIVFLLLVFFMVTMALQQAEKQMVINPPQSTTGDDLIRRPFQIIINVDEEGVIVVNKKVWEVDGLADRLKELKRFASSDEAPDFSVIIRADGATAHQHVISVMDACFAADMRQIWFVTIDREL